MWKPFLFGAIVAIALFLVGGRTTNVSWWIAMLLLNLTFAGLR